MRRMSPRKRSARQLQRPCSLKYWNCSGVGRIPRIQFLFCTGLTDIWSSFRVWQKGTQLQRDTQTCLRGFARLRTCGVCRRVNEFPCSGELNSIDQHPHTSEEAKGENDERPHER